MWFVFMFCLGNYYVANAQCSCSLKLTNTHLEKVIHVFHLISSHLPGDISIHPVKPEPIEEYIVDCNPADSTMTESSTSEEPRFERIFVPEVKLQLHEEEPPEVRCPVCMKMFYNRVELKMHMLSHHPQHPKTPGVLYRCTKCNKR